MQAGSLRHLITFEKKSSGTPDGEGNILQPWVVLYADVPASVNPLTSREAWVGEHPVNAISHRVVIRFLEDIDTHCRIKFGQRYFSIEGIINTEERCRELVIGCKEAVQ